MPRVKTSQAQPPLMSSDAGGRALFGAGVLDSATCSSAFANDALPTSKVAVRLFRNRGRSATGHVRIAAGNAQVGDTITLTVGGNAYVFTCVAGAPAADGEFQQGGAAADSAANLAAAILAWLGPAGQNRVLSEQHASDTGVVDFILVTVGATLAVATTGANITVQDNADEIAAAEWSLYGFQRAVSAEDDLRQRIVFVTGLNTIVACLVELRDQFGAAKTWDGTTRILDTDPADPLQGQIELDYTGSVGANDPVAGDQLTLMVIGY